MRREGTRRCWQRANHEYYQKARRLQLTLASSVTGHCLHWHIFRLLLLPISYYSSVS